MQNDDTFAGTVEIQVDPVTEPEESVQVTVESPSSKKRKVEVRIVTPITKTIDGKVHYCVVVKDTILTAYFVEASKLEFNFKTWQKVGASDLVEEVYSWEEELREMFTHINEVKQNIFLSFLRAGAFGRDTLNVRQIRDNMFNSAFPYRIE